MKILHLNSYYFSSKVHIHLAKTLDDLNIEQDIYVPLKINEMKEPEIELKNGNFFIKNLYKNIDRVLYYPKINKIYKPLKVMLKENNHYDLTHAHSLFVNGALSLKVYENFNIPYVVAVRATDIHLFFKYFKHLKKLALKILLNAKKIYILNEGHKNKILNIVNNNSTIKEKMVIVPNGIDNFWHDNKNLVKKEKIDKVELLFVGQFIKRKNILTILKAIKNSPNIDNLHLTLIGDGNFKDKIIDYVQRNNLDNYVNIIPWITKEELLNYYKKANIFINIAPRETFGLVYIEALTQNCFIIYTKGEGVDGLIPKEYGQKINPFDEKELLNVISNFNSDIKVKPEFLNQFTWKNVGLSYIEDYKKVLK